VSLFLSQLPCDHGALTRGTRIGLGRLMLAERYRSAGYRTAAFTAGGYLQEWYGFAQGFDVFERHEHTAGVGTEPIVAAALRWIRRDSARPFFLFVHTYAPHMPYIHRERADPRDAGRISGSFSFDYLEQIRRGELVPTEAERRYVRALYEGGVAYADRAIGRLFDELRHDGRLDRMLTIVVSDHGEDLWDHVDLRSPDHGHSLYEELLRIPLIVRGPGVGAGNRVRSRVSLLDIAPTLLALSGLPRDPVAQGRDLTEAFLRGREPSPEPVFAEATSGAPDRFALTVGDAKAIVAPGPNVVDGVAAAPLEIFDLATDPAEHRPSADEAGAGSMVDTLRIRVAACRARTSDVERARPTDEIAERLRELGYTD
jgi:choline-sulfatase